MLDDQCTGSPEYSRSATTRSSVAEEVSSFHHRGRLLVLTLVTIGNAGNKMPATIRRIMIFALLSSAVGKVCELHDCSSCGPKLQGRMCHKSNFESAIT